MEPKITRDFFLLSLNPKNGYYFRIGNELNYGLLGGIVADLYREKRIAFREKSLVLVDPSVTNYPFFDKVIELIKRKGAISIWSLLSRMGMSFFFYKRELTNCFLQNNDLIKVIKRFLGIPYKRYYASDRDYRASVIRSVRDILLRNQQPTPDELLLLVLIYSTRMYRPLSDIREERKIMRRKLTELFKNGAANYANFDHINELQRGLHRAIQSANARAAAVSS